MLPLPTVAAGLGDSLRTDVPARTKCGDGPGWGLISSPLANGFADVWSLIPTTVERCVALPYTLVGRTAVPASNELIANLATNPACVAVADVQTVNGQMFDQVARINLLTRPLSSLFKTDR